MLEPRARASFGAPDRRRGEENATAMTVQIGDHAPDFVLNDQNNQPVRLSDFAGARNVLLVFYPLAFSAVCSSELCALRDELPSFSNDDVALLTVSVDSVFAHKVWADREGFEFPLLADFWPHGAVAQSYGVFNDQRGLAQRATFLIDIDGIVRYKVVNDIPTARNQAEYLTALRSLAS
jgi:peroxiredoxin